MAISGPTFLRFLEMIMPVIQFPWITISLFLCPNPSIWSHRSLHVATTAYVMRLYQYTICYA